MDSHWCFESDSIGQVSVNSRRQRFGGAVSPACTVSISCAVTECKSSSAFAILLSSLHLHKKTEG